MGCATSKQALRDLRRSPSPLHRSYSVPSCRLTSSSLELQYVDLDANHDMDEVPPTELVEAKAWSEMMSHKIPRTPTMTPPNEPETINAWDLMADLEDDSIPVLSSSTFDRRSFSFFSTIEVSPSLDSISNSLKPIDTHSNIVSNFNKEVHEVDATKARGRVVVYFTSLRGVRKTYEDCCSVKEILRKYGVRINERDVLMDRGFREELRALCGGGGMVLLPMVLVKGRCLGGVEEVRRMHEAGELGEVMFGCEAESSGGPCEGCGDVRFTLCQRCSGSCKVYEEEEGCGDCGFQPCSECNENGMVRCSICF